MEESKFILVLGDHEKVVHLEQQDFKIREIGLNFSQSPSIGAIYETFPECARDYAEKLRESGEKVGIYGSREKAKKYFFKCLNISDNAEGGEL